MIRSRSVSVVLIGSFLIVGLEARAQDEARLTRPSACNRIDGSGHAVCGTPIVTHQCQWSSCCERTIDEAGDCAQVFRCPPPPAAGGGRNYGLPRGRRYYNGRYFGPFNNRFVGPQYGYF
jgi:hypothetical protein